MASNSFYVIAISPNQPSKVDGIFRFESGSVESLLENPGSFRWAGWDLNTLDRAKIRNGEAIEVSNGERKVIRVYEDGTLLVRGLINEDFLGWGTRDETFEANPRLHALAAIEFATATVFFYKRLTEYLNPIPKTLTIHQEIINGRVGGRFMFTEPYRVNTVAYAWDGIRYELSDANPKNDLLLESEVLVNEPDVASFEVVKKLFLFFGVPTTQIPYVKLTAAKGCVAVDEIAAI